MERSGRLLTRVSSVFRNLNSSKTDDALDAIARDYAPKLAQHQMRIALNPDLFRRVADLYARRAQPWAWRRTSCACSSAAISVSCAAARCWRPSRRRAWRRFPSASPSLQTAFRPERAARRRGLAARPRRGLISTDCPDFARAAAAQAATERGLAGRYVITLARSSVEPFLTFSARRDLRQLVLRSVDARAARSEGPHDNRPLIREILALRAEHARLLGYDTYAAYRLDDSMAKQTTAVEGLLRQVWEPAKHKAAAERADMQALARGEGMNAAIEAWDWRYYAEKVRRAKYDLDEAEIKPYFVLENMVARGVRHGGAAVRRHLHRAHGSPGLSRRCARL